MATGEMRKKMFMRKNEGNFRGELERGELAPSDFLSHLNIRINIFSFFATDRSFC